MNTAIWFGIMLVTGIFEAATAGLVTIWFTFGALAALIASVLGATPFWQVVIFIVVSALLLLATRPFVKKHLTEKKVRTNYDRLIGQECMVTEEINNIEGRGAVKIAGQEWSAKSADGAVIETSKLVRVKEIQGVHAIVEKV